MADRVFSVYLVRSGSYGGMGMPELDETLAKIGNVSKEEIQGAIDRLLLHHKWEAGKTYLYIIEVKHG